MRLSLYSYWHTLSLLSVLGIARFILAQEYSPTGKYLLVTKDYNAHCVEIRDDAPIDKHYPISQQPTSARALRQFCGNCSDSYNTYKVESGTSSYWIIPDQGRLNVFQGDKWAVWMINNCYPLLLRAFDSILYVLCSVGDSAEQQATVYTVNVTQQMPDITPIQLSQVNPNVATFFMKDGYVHLCVATVNNTLLFHNFQTGQQPTQPLPSSCLYISQLTAFEGANGGTQLLVECTGGRNDTVTLTMTYDTQTASFANTSVLGSHRLGKNVVSPDGSVIASCSSGMCVFSQLKVNSSITVKFSVGSSAIHSASFTTVENSLVFVVAVSGPNPGLYWFNVTLALTTGDEMGGPQFVSGSETVCVSTQCPGITLTDTGFILAAVAEGTKVEFFLFSRGSHFGPIGIGRDVVARIIVIGSGEQPTDSHGGPIPPHDPITKTIWLVLVVIPIVGTLIPLLMGAFIYSQKRCKCRRRHVMEQHPMADLAQEGRQQMVDPVQEVGPKRMDLAQEDPQQARDPVQEVGRPQMQQLDEVAGIDSPQKQMEQLVPGTILLPRSSETSSSVSMTTSTGSVR